MMIVRMYIILCSNFCNNLLMWFFFQLYVDSNSLPKFKDRKSIILQCSSYLKLLFGFSLNSVMASLLQFLLSPSHHCPLLIIKKKHIVLTCRGNQWSWTYIYQEVYFSSGKARLVIMFHCLKFTGSQQFYPTALFVSISHVNFAYRPMFCSFWKSWANNEIIFTGEFNFSIIWLGCFS